MSPKLSILFLCIGYISIIIVNVLTIYNCVNVNQSIVSTDCVVSYSRYDEIRCCELDNHQNCISCVYIYYEYELIISDKLYYNKNLFFNGNVVDVNTTVPCYYNRNDRVLTVRKGQLTADVFGLIIIIGFITLPLFIGIHIMIYIIYKKNKVLKNYDYLNN